MVRRGRREGTCALGFVFRSRSGSPPCSWARASLRRRARRPGPKASPCKTRSTSPQTPTTRRTSGRTMIRTTWANAVWIRRSAGARAGTGPPRETPRRPTAIRPASSPSHALRALADHAGGLELVELGAPEPEQGAQHLPAVLAEGRRGTADPARDGRVAEGDGRRRVDPDHRVSDLLEEAARRELRLAVRLARIDHGGGGDARRHELGHRVPALARGKERAQTRVDRVVSGAPPRAR